MDPQQPPFSGGIPPERLEQYRAALGGAAGPLGASLAGADGAALRARLEAPEVKAALEANRSRMLLMNANASAAAPGTAGAPQQQQAAGPAPAQPLAGSAAAPQQQQQQQPAAAMGSQYRNPVFGEVSSAVLAAPHCSALSPQRCPSHSRNFAPRTRSRPDRPQKQASRPSPDKSREYTPKSADAVRAPAAGALSSDAALPPLGDLFAPAPELPAGLRFDAAAAAAGARLPRHSRS